jgi:hypothetical protein
MNTEYALGKLRIRFESRARRRWFVALCFVAFAIADLVLNLVGPMLNQGIHLNLNDATGAWIVCVCGVLFIALFIVLTGLSGNMHARGDERESHRRDHAHFVAYYFLGYGLVAALFAGYFRGPNPIMPLLPLAVRGFLLQLPYIILVATGILYITLPQAILLWTEPDMDAAPPIS